MTNRKIINEYLLIVLGCLLTALSFNLFFIPNQIAPGGLSGIATVLYYLFRFPVGITTLVLNIPCLYPAFDSWEGILAFEPCLLRYCFPSSLIW